MTMKQLTKSGSSKMTVAQTIRAEAQIAAALKGGK